MIRRALAAVNARVDTWLDARIARLIDHALAAEAARFDAVLQEDAASRESTPLYEQVRTVRVGMAADVREATGLADAHLDEWDRELIWTEEEQ